MTSQSDSMTAHVTENTTLKPAINAWTVYLDDQGCSPHTVKAFKADMLLVTSYLPPDRIIGDITTIELNQFLDWMQKIRRVPCSPKSYARRITSIKAFFNWLHQYGVLGQNPAEQVIQRSVISPLPLVLNPDEIAATLEVAQSYRHAKKPDARYYTLLKLLLDTGIKKSECLGISMHHLEMEDPENLILFIRYANPTYRYKERKISINPEWLKAYQEYLIQYDIKDSVFPWSQRRLEYLLEDLGNEAGLEKHLSFDMCRWTCVLTDYQAGVEHNKIRQKMGISKIQWREIGMKLARLAHGEEQSKPK